MTTELTNHDSKCAFGKSQRVLYLRWPGFVRDLSLARSLSHSLNAMFAPTIFSSLMKTNICFVQLISLS